MKTSLMGGTKNLPELGSIRLPISSGPVHYVVLVYASDVLGGALTGIIAAVIVRSAYWEGTRMDRLITSIL